jgi:hypothetical protein
MEALILLALLLIVLCLVVPLVAIAKASSARRAVDDLAARVARLEKGTIHKTPSPAESPVGEGVAFPGKLTASPLEQAVPPPLPVAPPIPVAPAVAASRPASPLRFAPPPPVVRATRTAPVINWEQFMGAKLFAWIGGFALFLGVAFFVKYSFEHNLVPPEIRVAIGFVIGLGLLIGGVVLRRKENVVTAQTLSATGILILYAVTFACRSYYHFSFFGLVPTLLLMTLITATAFVVAVRMDAMLVAVLGMAGGFFTPILLSTGQDNPFGLFGYIALLDVGLVLVARRKDWHVLPILGAAGTVLMQMGWIGKFFYAEHYFAGHKTFIPMGIFLAFEVLFLATLAATRGETKTERTLMESTMAVGFTALLWTFFFLTFHAVAHRPIVLFGYLFLADLGLLAIFFLKDKAPASLGGAAGIAVFTFLAIWTGNYLVNAILYVALAAYLLFAILHTAFPLFLQRTRGTAVPWWGHIFPALTLLLVLIPIFNLPEVSFLVWPMILCVDLLAIILATATGLMLPVLAVLLLTFVVVGSWMLRIPVTLTGLPSSLTLLGGFAIFFLCASVWASRNAAQFRGPKSSPCGNSAISPPDHGDHAPACDGPVGGLWTGPSSRHSALGNGEIIEV